MRETKFDIDDAIEAAKFFESSADSVVSFSMERYMSNAELLQRIDFLKSDYRKTVYDLGKYIRSAKAGVLLRD